MTRFRSAALAICAVLFAIATAGCGNSSATPSPTPISDPNEIMTLSITRLAAAASLHMDGTLSGSVNTGSLSELLGGAMGGPSVSIKVDGATLTGEVDMTQQALHLSASFPTLFGISAEAFLVDGFLYTRINTPGVKYKKTKVQTSLLMASAAPDATFNFTDTLSQLASRVRSVGVTTTLVGHEQVDGRDVYHLAVTVPADVLNRQIGPAGGAAASGIALDLAPIDYWVYVDTLQPAKMVVRASSATVGNLTVTLTLTKYNQPVTIKAPADSEIEAGQ